jgi:hypothetical protein
MTPARASTRRIVLRFTGSDRRITFLNGRKSFADAERRSQRVDHRIRRADFRRFGADNLEVKILCPVCFTR